MNMGLSLAGACGLDLFCKKSVCIFQLLINQSALCLSLEFSPPEFHAAVEEPTTAAGDLARLLNNCFLKGRKRNTRDPIISLKNHSFHLGLFFCFGNMLEIAVLRGGIQLT